MYGVVHYVNKCHSLQIGTRNQKFEYEIDVVKVRSLQSLKILASRLRHASTSPTSSNPKMQQVKNTECWVLLTETSPTGINI